MNKYVFPPENYAELSNYVISDKKSVIEIILKADSFVFYDTCSLRHHVKLSSPESIFSFITDRDAIVVLINMVITELESADGSLAPKDINYIKQMHNAGIKILVLAEEWVPDLLSQCYRSYKRVNGFISKAVKDVVPAHSDIRDWIKSKPDMYNDIMVSIASANRNIGKNFFLGIKEIKKSGDDLGETLIAICTHLLMSIPIDRTSFLIFSDDKGAVGLFGRINTKNNDSNKKVNFISTAKLCWLLNRKYGLCDKEQINAMLSCISGKGKITVSCTTEYDLEPLDNSYTIAELEELITNEKTFTVFM